MDAVLERNDYGCEILTFHNARELVASGADGPWYIAPFATHWTVGMETRNRRHHLLDERGEPFCFTDESEAREFLQRELHVPRSKLPVCKPLLH